MKIKFILGIVTAVSAAVLISSSDRINRDGSSEALLNTLEDIPTIQAFLKDPVPEADLKRIVRAGVNAPSGMNRQPWHFTVISSPAEIEKLATAQKESMKNMKFPPAPPKGMDMPAGAPPKMPNGPKSGLGDSPAVIIISCLPGSEFDAGLACECMNDMANALGYGTKIVGSVTMLFNGENKAEYYGKFQIPEGQEIIEAILIGKVNTADYDAVSTASPRNPIEEVVTFLK